VFFRNPNTGFVGDITGSSIGYSVYHGPVLALGRQYASDLVDLTGKSIDVIFAKLASGKPVWVISSFSFGPVPSNRWQSFNTPLGRLTMSFNEHSTVLTGYDAGSIYLNDPYNNIKNRKVNRNNFIQAWKQFGSQAISFA
jgi:uncharacterized protein YvpB